MALVTCTECKKEISDQADKCPACGANNKRKKTSKVVWFFGAIFGFVVLSTVFNSANKAPTPTPAAVTRTPEEIAASNQKQQRFDRVSVALLAIKNNLKDPSSVQWNKVYSDDTADVICIEYRAKNSFGALNFERVAIAKGKIYQEASAWNKHCANGKSFFDMTYVKRVAE